MPEKTVQMKDFKIQTGSIKHMYVDRNKNFIYIK